MSSLQEAFKIPINCENQDFVQNPYIPFQLIGKQPNDIIVHPNLLTVGRCFDIKYGAKNCFAPTYTPQYPFN